MSSLNRLGKLKLAGSGTEVGSRLSFSTAVVRHVVFEGGFRDCKHNFLFFRFFATLLIFWAWSSQLLSTISVLVSELSNTQFPSEASFKTNEIMLKSKTYFHKTDIPRKE